MKLVSTMLALLIGLYLVWLLTGHLAAACDNIAAPRRFPQQPVGTGFNSTNCVAGVFSNLFIMCSDAGSFADRADAGIDLIHAHGLDQKHIACLDCMNPFPLLLGAPYPTGQPVWLDADNTFDASNHLLPEVVFGGTDVLMVPKRVSTPACLQLLLKIYGHYITNNFEPVAQNGYWTLLTRKQPEVERPIIPAFSCP